MEITTISMLAAMNANTPLVPILSRKNAIMKLIKIVESKQRRDDAGNGKVKDRKVSRVPIRQAIIRLVAEGIMDVIPKVGTMLKVIDRPQQKELFDQRVALEAFILTHLASRRKRELEKISLKLEEMKRVIDGKDPDEPPTPDDQERFIRCDEEFHEEIANAAGYPLLAEQLKLFASQRALFARHHLIYEGALRPDVDGEVFLERDAIAASQLKEVRPNRGVDDVS